MPVAFSIGAPKLDGGKTRLFAKLLRSYLIGGDRIAKALTRLGVAVCTRKVESTPPVSFVVILVLKALYDRDVLLMPL